MIEITDWKVNGIAYLFSQFSSLEVLFSPISAPARPADAWTFMIWLAIIWKRKKPIIHNWGQVNPYVKNYGLQN